MVLFLNLLGQIQDNHNGPYPGNNISGLTFDPGGPTEYEVGTRGSATSGNKKDPSSFERRTVKMRQQQLPWLFKHGEN